ncbi:hypothetical protein GGX14DRAFT_699341 [Mycena pura]|uniref:Oxysterol-binding protein n=1 Tax=Mycena pura TaxID=153505 RepID=A0AAD6V3R8_9AGAR|nr:hypothetical protein GGX14DRAFT_699341 [Mycena pura]
MSPPAIDARAADKDAPAPPVPGIDESEPGRLMMLVQLMKKALGVKDILDMRISFPASLMLPIPNLEFMHFLDRPDMFVAINDCDDPFERILALVRFTLSKDLKLVRTHFGKPYNSILGEHFRAHWDVVPAKSPSEDARVPPVSPSTDATSVNSRPSIQRAISSFSTDISSVNSRPSIQSAISSFSTTGNSPSTAATSLEALSTGVSQLSLARSNEHVRVIYLTEQVSHHPPLSAYYAACPSRSLEMYGIVQISARISGTALRVTPGSYNKGIFVNITGGPGAGEEYQLTAPVASVNGLLRGAAYLTVSESTIISCTGGKQRFRAIIEYKQEPWLGRPRFLLEGVIHTVVEGETQHNEWTKVKHVPQTRVVAVFDGSWRGRIRWRRVGVNSYPDATPPSSPSPSLATPSIPPASAEEEWSTLVDLSTLEPLPKRVRPLEKQLPRESRRLWENLTAKLLRKEFSDATREKVAIEQRQRDEAAERKRKGQPFVPCYFEKDMDKGHSTLTAAGRHAVEEELQEASQYDIEDAHKTA